MDFFGPYDLQTPKCKEGSDLKGQGHKLQPGNLAEMFGEQQKFPPGIFLI